ncbi:uncharacterized protein LOC133316484 [Gastrolobium bilobum]|uniref:uncharacterized protein LOC133316484 n=1 Tax=Gastrolobium bilobum TaxID=150636 RepID=UPI002AB18715|nr:uncharacterized protein LOC133316484 [Gastrolobium bilobum]
MAVSMDLEVEQMEVKMAFLHGNRVPNKKEIPGVGANLLGQHSAERNQDATAYVGNLDPQITEELLSELFVQAGPVVNVYVPKDRVTTQHQGYGFVEFRTEEDADYAIKVLNMIKLYGKPIRVNKASQLDSDVDEKLLYDAFSAFGVIVTNPKIMRDPESGISRGFGFISYDSFEASNSAIESSGPPTLPNVALANGTIAAPVPPCPFANGVAPAHIPALRSPPPQAVAFQPMPVAGQPAWNQQPLGQAMLQPVMPPHQIQQFRPPHSSMQMPPPSQAVPPPPRPLPPPTVMASQPPPIWRPPPPPQQQGGRPMAYPQSSMPPPPLNNPGMPPPSS